MSLCSACFSDREAGEGEPCPQCGWHAGKEVDSPYLALGTLLAGKYRVGRCLGSGGFGITYLCRDENLKALVAIKEYFPAQLARRGASGDRVSSFSGKSDDYSYGLEQFLREAQILVTYRDHANIVSILDYFPENGTGYMVMEYLPGCTFERYLAERQGRLPSSEALAVLTPVMDALRAIHADGVVHRDVSPDNILLLHDGRVKLIDFGAARRALKQKSQALSIILREGYAPFEQYQTEGAQGPWTDVYALAATFYRAITGQLPPMATDRVANDRLQRPSVLGVDFPPAMERLLLKGLAVMREDRYQNMGDFLADLRRAAGVERKQPQPAVGIRRWWPIAVLGGGAVAAGLSWFPVARPPEPTSIVVTQANPTVSHPEPPVAETLPQPRADVVVLRPRTAGEAKVKCPQAAPLWASPFFDDAPQGIIECGKTVDVLGKVFGAPRVAIRRGDGIAYVPSDVLIPVVAAAPSRETIAYSAPQTVQAAAVAVAPASVPPRQTVEAVSVPQMVQTAAVAMPAASVDCVIPTTSAANRNLAGCALSGRNLRGAALNGANLSKADLSGADLSGADLSNANLRGANLSGADLRGAKLERANADDADLRRAKLGKTVRKLLFRRANLRDTELRGVRFVEAVGDGADFTHANLVDAEFPSSSLKGAVFFGADLKDTYWTRADLTGIDLRQARNVSDEELRKAYACDTDLYKPPLRGCSGLGGMVESLAAELIKDIPGLGGKQ